MEEGGESAGQVDPQLLLANQIAAYWEILGFVRGCGHRQKVFTI